MAFGANRAGFSEAHLGSHDSQTVVYILSSNRLGDKMEYTARFPARCSALIRIYPEIDGSKSNGVVFEVVRRKLLRWGEG
jgi:hypothetical protein